MVDSYRFKTGIKCSTSVCLASRADCSVDACVRTYIHTYVCINKQIHICMCVYMYVDMYIICLYIYMYKPRREKFCVHCMNT